jgi:hypothetical protein
MPVLPTTPRTLITGNELLDGRWRNFIQTKFRPLQNWESLSPFELRSALTERSMVDSSKDEHIRETRGTLSNEISLKDLFSYTAIALCSALFLHKHSALWTCTKAVFLKCALNLFTSVSRILRVTIWQSNGAWKSSLTKENTFFSTLHTAE